MKQSLRLQQQLKTLLIVAFLAFNTQISFGQTLIAGWDFQTTTNGGTAVLAAPNSPLAFVANFGVGNMYLDGTNGSSTWVKASSGNEVTSFGGTTVNAGTGFSLVTTTPASLALLGGNATPTSNGKFVVFKFSMTGFSNLIVSYATQRSATGFTSQIWEYSINGTNWFPVQTVTSAPTSFGLITLNAVSGLNNVGNAFLRFSGAGATNAAGNNRLDNIQFNATPATFWDGTAWSNGSPSASIDAIINGAYTTSANGQFIAKKLTVTSTGSLTVNSGNEITVQEELVANGAVTLESNGLLNQINPLAVNTGNVTVKRLSNPLKRFDYVMWSSPVDGTQTLSQFSPLTSTDPVNRFYTYDGASNFYVSVPNIATEFANANGYLIRVPNNHPESTPTAWEASFTGVPNNGTITLNSTVPGQYYSVGNPYPSTLNADAFIAANMSNTEALYFWRKTNGAAGSAYATWTTGGGVASPSSAIPNGFIQVGQGFICKANSTSIVFNNTMRSLSNANQTFRTASTSALPTTAIERNRIWLNLSNTTGVLGQTLVAYMTGATSGIDAAIDGSYINDSETALTSIVQGQEYIIQGRALPFEATDVVALGFKTETAGTFTISIFDKDGLFATTNQLIYLRDTLTNTIHELTAGVYTFTSAAGVFNNRFEVIYQSALSTDGVNFTTDSVVLYNQNNSININSGSATMAMVTVYDIRGSVLVQKKQINASETQVVVPATNQVLLVEITSAEGAKVVKKIVN